MKKGKSVFITHREEPVVIATGRCPEHNLPIFKSDGDGIGRCRKCYGLAIGSDPNIPPDFPVTRHRVNSGKFSDRIKEAFRQKHLNNS